MKTKEEIDELYHKLWDDFSNKYDDNLHYYSFVEGYTQCQEDMTKELYEFGKLVLDTFHSEGRTHSGNERLPRIKFDEWFNELNKKD